MSLEIDHLGIVLAQFRESNFAFSRVDADWSPGTEFQILARRLKRRYPGIFDSCQSGF